MLPCPICGMYLKFNEGRRFPDIGSQKRREICFALGVSPNTFKHVKTPRTMCLSHFNADQFHIGRHILKSSALPRKLTEKEKEVLLQSGFNKARIRKATKRACRSSSLIKAETILTPPEDDIPITSLSNDVTDDGPTQAKDTTNEASTSSQPNNRAESTSESNDKTEEISYPSANVEANEGSNDQQVKTSLNDNGLRLPKFKRIPISNNLKKMFCAPVKRISLLSSPEINCTPANVKVVKIKKQKETMASASCRFKIIRMPPGTAINKLSVTNNQVPTLQTNNDYGIFESSNDIKDVQTSSNISSSIKQVIKVEPSEFSTTQTNIKISFSTNELPSTSQPSNNDIFISAKEDGSSSNTNFILSRCLQHSFPDGYNHRINGRKFTNELISNNNISKPRLVTNKYKKRKII
uniref:THAP-type domain-containing protein n=1 Tax=Panagrolaimus sp. PS1159 TaxID=55785 RepID=A0AC35FZC0_9BILA